VAVAARGDAGGQTLPIDPGSSFFQGWTDDKGKAVTIPCDIFGRYDNDIDRLANTEKIHVDLFRETPPVEVTTLDDEQIDIAIAVRAHLVSCCGPEQNDSVRLRDLNNTVNDLIQGLLIEDLPLVHLSGLRTARVSHTHASAASTYPLPSHRIMYPENWTTD
jgi:hypothetical protein